jgi:hypothetical protein
MILAIRDAIIERLREHKRLPAGYQRPGSTDSPMNLARLATDVIGREEVQQKIMQYLTDRKAVILWGGPGEGKSTLAVDAACTLYQAGSLPGGALGIDMTGEACDLRFHASRFQADLPGRPLQRCPAPPRTCAVRSPRCCNPTGIPPRCASLSS